MVHAPAGHLHDDLLDRLVMVLRIDAVGRAHRARLVELGRVGIDGDDAPGLRLPRALAHRQAQRAEADPRDTVNGLNLRRGEIGSTSWRAGGCGYVKYYE